MTDTPVEAGASRRKLYFKLALLALLGVSGILIARFTPLGAYLEKERMLALLAQLGDEWWTPFLLIGLYCGFAALSLPATPLLLAGGMVFGFAFGTLYNLIGLMFGAMISFWIGKALGRDAIVQLAGQRLRRTELMFQKRGFWPLIHIRLLPIPFAVVGYAAALAGVPTLRYVWTSFLGLTPATMVNTFFVPGILRAGIEGRLPANLWFGYIFSIVLLNLIAGWPTVRDYFRRRARLKELREIRRSRRPG